METISREYVVDVYDELVNALRSNTEAARQQVVINSQLKQIKEVALADKTITGSNAGSRDAAWNEYFRDYVGADAHDALTVNLDQHVADTKLRLEIARIKVEELRLYCRIVDSERTITNQSHLVTNVPLDTPDDAEILHDLGLD